MYVLVININTLSAIMRNGRMYKIQNNVQITSSISADSSEKNRNTPLVENIISIIDSNYQIVKVYKKKLVVDNNKQLTETDGTEKMYIKVVTREVICWL